MYKYIVNPKSGRKILVKGKTGKKIIKQYIYNLNYIGGHGKPCIYDFSRNSCRGKAGGEFNRKMCKTGTRLGFRHCKKKTTAEIHQYESMVASQGKTKVKRAVRKLRVVHRFNLIASIKKVDRFFNKHFRGQNIKKSIMQNLSKNNIVIKTELESIKDPFKLDIPEYNKEQKKSISFMYENFIQKISNNINLEASGVKKNLHINTEKYLDTGAFNWADIMYNYISLIYNYAYYGNIAAININTDDKMNIILNPGSIRYHTSTEIVPSGTLGLDLDYKELNIYETMNKDCRKIPLNNNKSTIGTNYCIDLNNSEHLELIKKFYNNLNKLTTNQRFKVLNMKKNWRVNEPGHANVIIIDSIEKTIEYFEPHGGIVKKKVHPVFFEKRIKYVFSEIYPDYKWINLEQFLPLNGIQEQFEHRWSKEFLGLCQLYCFYYVILRVSNPQVSRLTISTYIVQSNILLSELGNIDIAKYKKAASEHPKINKTLIPKFVGMERNILNVMTFIIFLFISF